MVKMAKVNGSLSFSLDGAEVENHSDLTGHDQQPSIIITYLTSNKIGNMPPSTPKRCAGGRGVLT